VDGPAQGELMRRSRATRLLANGPKGLPWPKDTPVYHATTAMPAILDHGFKTRAELGGRNATGGGPDNSISFTLNKSTAVAIAIGLRTIRGITRAEIGLGDLIIQAQQVCPQALTEMTKNLEVDAHVRSPEDVIRVDRGLEWFTSHYANLTKAQVAEILASGTAEAVVDHGYGVVEGWVPSDVLARVKPERWGSRGELYELWRYRRQVYQAYRGLLSFGSWNKEVYDPVFFTTDIGPISRLSDDDIGIVSAKIAADWVCATYLEAESLGYDPGGMEKPRMWPSTMSDWKSGCEFVLRYPPDPGELYRGTLPTGWDPPTREDTIVYLGSMAELRVYDLSLIRDVRESENLHDCVNYAQDAWDRKGKVVDEPYFMPYHRDDTFTIARSR
jgi:hypothetical protein